MQLRSVRWEVYNWPIFTLRDKLAVLTHDCVSIGFKTRHQLRQHCWYRFHFQTQNAHGQCLCLIQWKKEHPLFYLHSTSSSGWLLWVLLITHTHARAPTHPPTRTQHARARTHTHTNARTRAHARTHTHTDHRVSSLNLLSYLNTKCRGLIPINDNTSHTYYLSRPLFICVLMWKNYKLYH